MQTVFIGVDISKEWLDYSIVQGPGGIPSKSSQLSNNVKGITQLIKKLSKAYDANLLWFCFEHTGHYGMLLSSLLQTHGITYSAVPAMEIKNSIGMQRGKTDAVDAQRITQYASLKATSLKPSSLPVKVLLQIKSLLAYRQQLVKSRTQCLNSLKEYKVAQQVIDVKMIIKAIKRKIDALSKEILSIENEVKKLIEMNSTLKKNFNLATSVKGVGFIIAAYMLIYTNNFTSFQNPRKFNCFTGLAPFEHSSGVWKGSTKTSHYRHRHLKSLLFNGANSAVQHDPQLKAYLARQIEKGKHRQSVMNAVACKLVYRVFAIIKRQSPYVLLAH